MVDETTDVSIINEMVVYAMYLAPGGRVVTSFLSIISLPDGKANTIEHLIAYLEGKNIPLSHTVGFGSDGAAVMNGKHASVTQAAPANVDKQSLHCTSTGLGYKLSWGWRIIHI